MKTPAKQSPAKKSPASREKDAARRRAQTATVKEIGPIPRVKNPARVKKCAKSLKLFCQTYLRARFNLAWSQDHLKVIARLEEVILRGGRYALAMPRSSGKTELAKAAALWALLYGYRRYVVIVAAEVDKAAEIIESIKKQLTRNALLLADFPAVCYPIRKLEGEARRCVGQTCKGRRTEITWGTYEIRLPNIKKCKSAGAVVAAVGITGSIRGANKESAEDSSMRPDLALIDDVQTRTSARSFEMTNSREMLIEGDVMQLAGPDVKMAGVMLCTCIYPADLSDRHLDRDKHPEWRGERYKAIYRMPEKMNLWEQYWELRAEDLRGGGDGSAGSRFYVANRGEMDAGSHMAWDGFRKGEISALQAAMNVFFSTPEVFFAEWQNTPKMPSLGDSDVRQLTEADLSAKLDRRKRGLVQSHASTLTAFVDVHDEILFYGLCAWDQHFGGALVDYGAFPPQRLMTFTSGEPSVKLSEVFPGIERKAAIYAGLCQIFTLLFGRAYPQDNGAAAMRALTIGQGLVDSGFEPKTVHDAIVRSPFRALLWPSKGKGIGAKAKPMNNYKRYPGDWVGNNCRIAWQTSAVGRHVEFDANSWKSFIADGLLAPPGSRGSIYLPGESLNEHPLLVDHLLAEYRVRTFGQGRWVDEWLMRPGKTENHWWDCLVGCAVAANKAGVTYSAPTSAGESPATAVPRKKKRLSDSYKAAQQRSTS
jgi:phage terminase large subunit GpA